jgi:uncharacterized protein
VFQLMAKPTGAICNLDCDYCFFLSKEQLYPGSPFRMDDDVLAAYVRQLLAGHPPGAEVTFAFQGGEPTLMGVDFFARCLELQEIHKQPGQQILNTIQTNATLVDERWARFLADHGFLVGVSVDGPREMHDAYRRDKGGKPTFDRVVAGLRNLQSAGVEWNALTTVNAANADHGLTVYRFLTEELHAQFIQFIPIVERVPEELLTVAEQSGWGARNHRTILYTQSGSAVTSRSVGPGQYGRFLIDVFEQWVRHDVGDVFVQMFDTTLARFVGYQDVGLCVHAPTCGDALALEHNGDIYSCDHFVEPAYRVGNLADGRTLLEIVDSPAQRAFGAAKRDSLPDYCRRCDVRFACNGGCPKDRFLSTPDGEPGLHYLCESYRSFFGHVDKPMRLMASVLRQGGSADEVRGWYAARDAKRDPAHPCTCNSGLPFGQCHAPTTERTTP